MSSFQAKAVLYLVAGALLVPCVGTLSALQTNAWAQPTATDAQVKAAWDKLLADSLELEATDPQGAITRYQKFFEETGYRSPAVGAQISLRIARIYQLDLKNTDKAIEIYDWALALYKGQPDAIALQKGRLAALEAQKRREGAPGETAPATTQGETPLTIVPRPAGGGGLGVNVAPPQGTQLGVGVTPALNAGTTGVNQFSPTKPNGGLGVNLPSTTTQKSIAVSLPLPPGNALGWQPGPQRCVAALAQQPNGMLWVATEDSGVWRYDPAIAQLKDRWTQFTAKDGLADESTYALAVDQKGRVWAGTLNHGVSVWNGVEWKNYGVLDGPLGERVFDIAVCPTDGDVWIATNAGLTRYSQQNDSWSYVTRADGLPSDEVQAIAFDKNGNIVLGTQCDGVALAQVADGYKNWRVVQGPEKMPLTATGQGLPSNLINDVLVGRDGTIYAATTTGLAWSSDGGAKWVYVRGQDYADKVRGLYSGAPAEWKEGAGAVLAEDYVSCLAQDEAGRLWVGHWNAGSEMLQMQSGTTGLGVKEVSYRKGSGFIKAILPRAQGALLLARYDEGLSYGSAVTEKNEEAPTAAVKPKIGVADLTVTLSDRTTAKAATEPNSVAVNTTAASLTAVALPSAAKAPTLDELNTMLASLSKVELGHSEIPVATNLADDWTTQGDWLGRYGKQNAILWAIEAPYNGYFDSTLYGSHTIQARLGTHYRGDDALRHWINWEKTDNPNSLYYPDEGYRRQAELDDHGEGYERAFEGPDIWQYIEVPQGIHRISLYFFNKDGSQGENRCRDYIVEVKQCKSDPEEFKNEKYWSPGWVNSKQEPQTYSTKQILMADAQPTIVRTRVRDFRGGVYKNLVVSGPGRYWVKIAKNYSFNTICSGTFIDRLQGPATKQEDSNNGLMLGNNSYHAPDIKIKISDFVKKNKTGDATDELSYTTTDIVKEVSSTPLSLKSAIQLWQSLDEYKSPESEILQRRYRLMAFRAVNQMDMDQAHAIGGGEMPEQKIDVKTLLDNWSWQLSLWDDHGNDRRAFDAATELMYRQFREVNDQASLNQGE